MLQIAGIGVTRMGGNTIKSIATHEKVKFVALCDVDASHLAQAAAIYKDTVNVADWRDLLAKHADKFDAITVGVPDHSHAPIASARFV